MFIISLEEMNSEFVVDYINELMNDGMNIVVFLISLESMNSEYITTMNQ